MKFCKVLSIFVFSIALILVARPTRAGWAPISLPPTVSSATLRDVEFISSLVAIAVGSTGTSGLVLRSTNGGNTWVQISMPSTSQLKGVTCVSTTCWAVSTGGAVIKSTDGGNTWLSAASPTSGTGYNNIQFRTSSVGHIVRDDGGYYRTTSGVSWTGVTMPTSEDLNDLHMGLGSGGTTGYIAGDNGTILKTTNDGLTWTLTTIGGVSPKDLQGIDCSSDTYCFAVGEQGVAYLTTNGSTWSEVVAPVSGSASFFEADIVGSNIFVAQGGYHLWKLTTGVGSSLTEEAIGGTPPVLGVLYSVRFFTTLSGLAVGGGSILKYDITAPTSVSVSINSGAAATNSASANLTLNCVDGTGCNEMKIAIDGTIDTESWEAYATSKAVTLPSGSGTKTVAAKFRDGALNESAIATDTIVLDTIASTVGAIMPTTATVSSPRTLTATYSDSVGVASCNLYIESVDRGPMTLSGTTVGVASRSYTFTAVGNFIAQARCLDTTGNLGIGASQTIVVSSSPPPVDTTAPGAPGGLTRTSASDDITPIFAWSAATDNVGVTAYEVQVDGSLFTNIGNTLTYEHTTALTVGSHTFAVRARDAAGNMSGSSSLDFSVTATAPGTDTTSPASPTNLTRTSGDTNTLVTITWSAATDNVGVTGYEAQIDGGGFINLANVLTYSFSASVGSHTLDVRSYDAALNRSANASLSFTIASPVQVPTPTPAPTPTPVPTPTPSRAALPLPAGINYGDLVKLADDGNPNTYADTSVFYIGTNGRRYVFPNDKTYFTWYSDFSTVKTISSSSIAEIPLAGNVNYRPGVKMVKLQTNPDVYVVSRGGLLRKVPSEEIAKLLYGDNWNQKIDDVSDAFWFNYRVDTPLVSASDFSTGAETSSTLTISADKGL